MTNPERISILRSIDAVWLGAFLVVFLNVSIRNWVLGISQAPRIVLGPVEIRLFGLLVALAFVFGAYLIRRWCLHFGLDWGAMSSGVLWIGFLGLYISHLASIAFYRPELTRDPIVFLVDIRRGISSYGGFYGGAFVAWVFFRFKRLPALPYFDALAYGLVGAYIFGRLGCFAVHDHPGWTTETFFGAEIGGVKRHDLGLYEMLFLILLFAALNAIARRGYPPAGLVGGVTATAYAPLRFVLDFLRIEDSTWAGLTPAQWFCLPTLAIGIVLLRRSLTGSDRRASSDRYPSSRIA